MAEIPVRAANSTGRIRRVAETDRPPVTIMVDGIAVPALAGDTLLVAVLANGRAVRESEFGDGRRAGFCWMGACQDCWMWTDAGDRVRACTTPVEDGMAVRTSAEGVAWPRPA